MRILHVTTSLSDGGAEGVLYRLCTASTQHRHIVVSLRDAGKYGLRLSQAGVVVHTLGMPGGRLRWRSLFKLWRLLRFERPDLVQTWMYHADLVGGVMARLSGVRALCWGIRNSDLQPGENKGTTILVARLCAWLSSWIPRRIVCCAERAATAHQAFGYDISRCVVIPNGYDVSHFRHVPETGLRLRERLSVSTDQLLIGLVARFDPQKDHANLLEALARVRAVGWQFEVVLVGTGMTQENALLTERIARVGLADSIHLLGRQDDIPAIMNALDLHVLSSLGEAFPNVLAEAMACGTPCVTTDVGDAALIVGDTGWVAPPGDPDALARAILEALSERHNAGRWAARQAAARTRIQEHFSLERMVKAYESLWVETCLSAQMNAVEP